MYIGCSAPKLIRLLEEELNRELKVRRGEARRKVLPFDKPTAAEIERQKRLDSVENAEKLAEQDRIASELERIRARAYEQIWRALKATSVVLLFPHSLDEGQTPEIVQQLTDKWRTMGIDIIREDAVAVNEEMANEIFHERRLPQHPFLVQSLEAGDSVALLLKKVRRAEDEPEPDKGGEGDVLQSDDAEEGDEIGDTYPIEVGEMERKIAETIYGFYPASGSTGSATGTDRSGEEIEVSLERNGINSITNREREQSITVSGSKRSSASKRSNGLEVEVPIPKEMQPAEGSPAALLLRRLSAEKVTLPGIYTPLTPYSKAAAVRVLFPTYAEQFYEMETLPPEPPPSVVMVFDASKREEVIAIAEEFKAEVLKMSFFNDKKQKLVETAEEYSQLSRRGLRDSIVLAVDKTRSAPILALSTAGPSYISPNAKIAKADDRIYFVEATDADLREETPEPETPEEDEEPTFTAPTTSLPPMGPVEDEDFEEGEFNEGDQLFNADSQANGFFADQYEEDLSAEDAGAILNRQDVSPGLAPGE